jgi:energy-coupling factor transport system ATP-binding protein
MNNNKQLISFSYIRVKYPSSKKELVYRGNIEINENDFVLFSGNSGCGKSTIFKVLNMLIPDYEYASVETDIKIKDISYKEEKKN